MTMSEPLSQFIRNKFQQFRNGFVISKGMVIVGVIGSVIYVTCTIIGPEVKKRRLKTAKDYAEIIYQAELMQNEKNPENQ